MNTRFESQNIRLQQRYEEALTQLSQNVRRLPCYDKPVLQEGGMYQGIWLECGPHEGTLYGEYEPEIARNNHTIFFDFMDAEGYIPPFISDQPGRGQLQTVVPLAQTAWECAGKLQMEDLLERAYDVCARYDDWLTRYRNSRGTDLVEAHCEWDTGHDNSPRHAGQGQHCPDYDPKRTGPSDGLPVLAPDLSATKYGGRVALARIAEALGKSGEKDMWLEKAETLRQAIMRYTFDDETGFFYDRDARGRLIRIKGDAGIRVLMEHVPDQALFEQILHAHILNPREFWTPYPMPSIAADEPCFDGTCTENSWGGASQALAALRAPLWLEHYEAFDTLDRLMEKWLEAILLDDGFRQQMNPFSGTFNTTERYSPCMLVLTDFIARRYGCKYVEDGILWSAGGVPGSKRHRYETCIAGRRCEVKERSNETTFLVNGKEVAHAWGRGRVLSDLDGHVRRSFTVDGGRLLVKSE